MRVLVTRPRDEAEALARRLGTLGFAAVIEPMIDVRAIAGARANADDAQAVAFTSANGVRALQAAGGGEAFPRDLPAFAVGAATAVAARAAGFRDVREGPGTVEELARLIVERCSPRRGPILHVSGSVVARDLAALLAPAGFGVRRAVLYEAVPAERIGPETRALLADGAIGAALFFSPRTAKAFVKLVRDSGLEPDLARVLAIALSPAVAEVLTPLPFARVATASRPTTDALLETLAGIAKPSHAGASSG